MKELNLKDFHNTKLIPFLESIRGVGKTQFVQDYCKTNKLDLFTLNLSAIDSSDFTGLPYVKNGVTEYAAPNFFKMKNGVLFLDEANRVNDNDVKAALHSLLLDRSINGHILDDTVLIVMAGNPVNEDYETLEFDASLQDRVVTIKFNHTFKDFVTYLKKEIKSIPFIKFVENNENLFEVESRRRIFETCKMIQSTKNDDYIQLFFNNNIFNLYNAFNSKRLFNLDNIFAGDKITDVVGIQSVTSDLINYMLGDFDTKNAKNINKFLTVIPPESKLLFFQALKESGITEKQVDMFLSCKVFDKLGKYLKVLF